MSVHYKTNRQNHDFQIKHFLAGACHTPDAAWALLSDLKDDRQMALDASRAHALRAEAKKIRARRKLESMDELEQLEGKADLLELEAFAVTDEKNIAAATAELKTIVDLMEKLEPLRKFKHLPDAEAHEAAQQEEWRLHLIWTAQNHLISSGTIPADHVATMRMHPEFETSILPLIDKMRVELVALAHKPGGRLQELSFVAQAPEYSVVHLLTKD